jgi:hypothetical protein
MSEERNIYEIQMHRWRIAFFGLVILIAGAAIGVSATLLLVRPGAGFHGPAGQMPPASPARMVDDLQHQLGLSPAQVQAVEPIVREHIRRLNEIRDRARPLIEEELRNMGRQVDSLLDDRQRTIWHTIQNRMPILPPPRPGQMPPDGRPKGPDDKSSPPPGETPHPTPQF